MTDEKFVMQEDIRARKGMAIGSKHKVVGSKTKKCRFPSDYLTKKEREALNGEVRSWNMNKFYSYDEFKQMPHDIQEQYLNGLIDKYDVSVGAISKILFGHSDTSLYNFAKKHKLKLNHCSTTGQGAQKNNIAFAEAITALRDYDDLEKEIDKFIPSPEAIQQSLDNATVEFDIPEFIPKLPKPISPVTKIDYAEFTFHGGIDYEALNTIVSKFTDGNVKIHIRIQKED